MLLSKTVFVKWNSKTKKHYEERGYQFTKIGDSFEVNVEDLTDYSRVNVEVECDYCHRTYQTQWGVYLKTSNKLIKKDCCNNPDCTGKKSLETIQEKYDVQNIRDIPGVNERISATNLVRYGAENPFGSSEIMQKIKETNMLKYGTEWYTQTDEYKERYRKTCLEKYGVPNYSYTDDFIKMMSGENSPVWKGDNIKVPRDTFRGDVQYRNWRKAVFDRDGYTCQCCGARNGNGKTIYLVAHHIINWAADIDNRYNIDNGITLCKDCHIAFHSAYGIKNNTFEQINDFIYLNNKELDEKIC